MQKEIYPFARPLYVMAKPVGAACNLACDYCYYRDKKYANDGNASNMMSESLLERFIQEYINSQSMAQVMFTWHGGEALLRPISFYKKAIAFQQKYSSGRLIENCIQTNGTLLTDEWCSFFKENDWLVGISIDGPQEFHDRYRCSRSGEPSFSEVMRGIELLNKHGVEWNAMAVVNDYNADYPLEFYRFFKSIGCRYLQFAPIVERIYTNNSKPCIASSMHKGGTIADFSVNPEQWGKFLCRIFDEWVRNDVGDFFIQIFDSTLANWVGEHPGVCTLANTCGHAGVLEINGDIYSCDHYVFPEYKLGNLYRNSLIEMMYGEKQLEFGKMKQDALPLQCKKCEFLFACNGECPKNRIIKTSSGEPGLNYLCEGYYRFFSHVSPYMDFMKNELLANRPPSNVMKAISYYLIKIEG